MTPVKIRIGLLSAVLPGLFALASAAAADGGATPTAAQGRQLYTSFCARCHGVNMINTGASFDLRSFPKDQRERFDRSVTQGLRAMPAWGTTFKPEELDALWLYVSSGGAP
jgi:cytochrome c55X